MLDSALIKAENDGYSKGSGKSPGQNQFASRVEAGCLHAYPVQIQEALSTLRRSKSDSATSDVSRET